MLTLTRRYDLDDEDARARLRALTDYWSTKHGIQATWPTETTVELSGKVMKVKFSGKVRVDNGTIDAEVEAGWLAERLGARGYVERKLDDYLDPTNTLESLRARIPKP
jgi:hypothetical protein